MKRIFGAVILVLSLTGIAPAAEMDPQLAQTLATISADQKLPVDFFLKAQANPLTLDASIAQLPKPERRAHVGRVLMDFAQEAQQDLMAYLRAKEVEGKVEAVKPLWIVNSVGCWATKDVICEVAGRSDIALAYYDRMPCELGKLELKAPAAPADGIEPAMAVVNVRGAWNQGYHGEGIVLGVVDTGCNYNHLDLRNRLWTSSVYPRCGFNFASSQYSSGHPGPSPYDTLDPFDYFGHGSHVAGVAVADGNYGAGSHDTMGIAPGAKFMALAVDVYLHSPYPDTSMENNTMQAFQFCIRPPRDTLNGADVINASLGLISTWLPRYAVWRRVEENVLAAGLTHFVAAGSEASPRTIRCPACCPPPWYNPANHPTSTAPSAVFTVGGTDNDDVVAPFSSQGPSDVWGTTPPYNDYVYPPGLTDPDVMMPCINIRAPAMGDSSYSTGSGTSFATSAAAAVACLMLSKDPSLKPWEIDSIIELCAVRDLGAPGKDNIYGAGRINCSLAVAFASPTGTAEQPVAAPQAPGLLLSPNPCRGKLVIRLPPTANRPSELGVYSASGALVRRLVIPQSAIRTPQCVVWDGKDAAGQPVAEGCYFCTLRTGLETMHAKLLLTR